MSLPLDTQILEGLACRCGVCVLFAVFDEWVQRLQYNILVFDREDTGSIPTGEEDNSFSGGLVRKNLWEFEAFYFA